MDFKNANELLALCEEKNLPISEIMRIREIELGETASEIVNKKMMVAYHQGNSGRPTTGRHRFSRYHQTELVCIGNFRLHPERRPQDHAAELYGTGLCLLLAYRHRQPLHRRQGKPQTGSPKPQTAKR